ncbi:MAG: TrbI/VirB10 family protein [Bryobacteraceae bacterium]|nr:TrbI/VirB10 family protein [Bryobacteraceae bacterium]
MPSQVAARSTSSEAREAKAGERTRALVLLAGGAVACVLLFFALFTTDGSSSRKERRTKPSLGRPENAASATDQPSRSPVPQLSVNQTPSEESGELTEKDLLGTMRNRGTVVPKDPPPPVPPKSPATQRRTLAGVNFDDPALAEAYRRQGLTPPPQRTEVVDWNAAIRDYQNQQQRPALAPSGPVVNPSEALRKSSIVYVRNAALTAVAQGGPQPALIQKSAGLLPQGTALVARLQHAVSSAAKVPVIAVIEYNYEDDGQLIIPAGTKAYGELAQATPQGWVTLKFDALEFPDGSRDKISGSAISMDRQMLRGYVNGKNTGMKVLTRALTGVGTIAAYAVGGRSANGGIDSSILLRERLASNVALAGEQQMSMLAYQQNIVVTVPAKTQFYLVLHEAGVSLPRPAQETIAPVALPGGATLQQASQRSTAPALTEQELRDMLQLRNEMREMNRLMQQSQQSAPMRPETPPEQR